MADSDTEELESGMIFLPGSKSVLLSLVTNTSDLGFANLVGPARLSELCQILHGASSAEVFTRSNQLHLSDGSFCAETACNQYPNLVSTSINAAGWGGKAWFNTRVPD